MKKKSDKIGQSVLKGSLILVIANLLVKVIGALFKIPLTNLLGNEGMGYFSAAYTIYSGLFTVATAGLPVAIAKMIAESTAHNNLKELKRIHHVSYVMFALVGIVGTGVLYFGAEELIKSYGDNPLCVKLVAPALFFVAIMSVYRGFFQGLSDMYPTAISELIESGAKLVVGFAVAYLLLDRGLIYGAAGAICGVTIGAILGAFFLIATFFKKRKNIYSSLSDTLTAPAISEVVKKLLYVALPVTISASVFTITNLIDVAQIGDRLSLIAKEIPKEQIISAMKHSGETITSVAEMETSTIVNSLYGMYTSKVITMLNLIPAIVVAVCLPLVPAIARAYAAKNTGTVSETTHMSIKFTIIFSLPGAVGIGVLADPILRTLFGTNDAAFLLRLITPAIVCSSIVLVTNSILQATGNVLVPVMNIAVAGVTKVIINYFLLAIPSVNINGVAIGSSVCYFIYMALNLFYVNKVTKPAFNIMDFIIKPAVSAGVMGIIVWAVNTIMSDFLGDGRMSAVVCTGMGVAAGGLVYVIALFKTGSLTANEIHNLPKGQSIARILTKLKLLREN